MRFPLADWIEEHGPSCPHHLSRSGMRGALRSTPRYLRRPESGSVDEVRERLGRLFAVRASRIFLTSGATEANMAVLLFESRRTSQELGRTPSARIAIPEYPPLRDAARHLGFRESPQGEPADLVVFSEPGNPIGAPRDEAALAELVGESPRALVDTTFREFTSRAPVPESLTREVWRTGTFTKAYGADSVRVGFVVAPEPAQEAFAVTHGLLFDEIADHSVDSAVTLLRHRGEILGETREIFLKNQAALRRALPGVPALGAPVWFDRGSRGLDGDAFAAEALKKGVLVCSGSFFADPHGVRICLTQRSFPADLRAYLEVRSRFLGEGRRPRAAPGTRT